MNEPTDPWAPGVRASDVPVMNGGDPNPLDTAGFEGTDAPLSPNRADIAARLYVLFPPDVAKGHPDAQIEIAYASPKTDDAGAYMCENFSAFASPAEVAAFAEKDKQGRLQRLCWRRAKGMPSQQAGQASRTLETGSKAWADFDDEGDDVSALPREKNILPSDIIQTGRTPHRRFQISAQSFPATSRRTPGGRQLRLKRLARR